MNLHSMIIPAYMNALGHLSGEVAKAVGWAGDSDISVDALLKAKLAPDMFPLETQIRFTCHQAREVVARLTDKPVPEIPQVSGLDALNALIDRTVGELAAVPADAFDGAEGRQVRLDLPNEMVFEMTGFEYVRDWAQPQFHFHRMTAYAIMRHLGVPLGKADYVAHALKYLKSPV